MDYTLNRIAFYSVLAPFLIAIILWKQLSFRQGILAGFCLASLGLQFLGRVLGAEYGTNTPAFHFYVLVEFLTFMWIFNLEWRNERLGQIISKTMIGFGLLAVFSAIWYPGVMNSPFLTRTFGHLVMLFFAGLFMWKTFQNMTYERLEKVFMFWFSTGILIYFTSTLMTTIFSEFVLIDASDRVFKVVWAIGDCFTILFYLICTIAMLCKDKKT